MLSASRACQSSLSSPKFTNATAKSFSAIISFSLKSLTATACWLIFLPKLDSSNSSLCCLAKEAASATFISSSSASELSAFSSKVLSSVSLFPIFRLAASRAIMVCRKLSSISNFAASTAAKSVRVSSARFLSSSKVNVIAVSSVSASFKRFLSSAAAAASISLAASSSSSATFNS